MTPEREAKLKTYGWCYDAACNCYYCQEHRASAQAPTPAQKCVLCGWPDDHHGPGCPEAYKQHLPSEAAERKAIPLATGVVDYFPDALLAVAALSKIGNDQHNPGQPLHWSRGKSTDHPDCLLRHFVDRGAVDSDGVRHSAKVAWRALAMLQLEIEASR